MRDESADRDRPAPEAVRALSGRSVGEIDLQALARGDLTADDVRISPETLRAQAHLAESRGYRPLADNLRRAAELATFADDELLAIYELLRPRRATASELAEAASRIEARAPRTAALIRSALDTYVRRGLVRVDR